MDSAYLTGMEPVTCVIALLDTAGITVKAEVSFKMLENLLIKHWLMELLSSIE